jgi:hypothetical protein
VISLDSREPALAESSGCGEGVETPRDQRFRCPQRPPPQLVYVNGLVPSDKRFRMPRSAGRVPPRCTARGPRNAARREHLIRFDRRCEAEQAITCNRSRWRKSSRRSAVGIGERRVEGSVLDSRPERHLNSITAPRIEVRPSSPPSTRSRPTCAGGPRSYARKHPSWSNSRHGVCCWPTTATPPLICEAGYDPDRLSFIRGLRVVRRQVTDQAAISP